MQDIGFFSDAIAKQAWGVRNSYSPCIKQAHASTAMPEDLIKKGEIKVKGNATEASRPINLFDRYRPEKGDRDSTGLSGARSLSGWL